MKKIYKKIFDSAIRKGYNTPCEICPETTSPGGRTMSCGSVFYSGGIIYNENHIYGQCGQHYP